jgi:leukotriene-A4 hydrolase
MPAIIEKHRPQASPEFDYTTKSSYADVLVKNTSLDLEILFDKKKIIGNVTYDLSVLKSFTQLILDSSYIKINSIKVNGVESSYSFFERKEPWGEPLSIHTSADEYSSVELSVDFETTEKSTAIQWLKTDPSTAEASDYVFTQLEPIHARALFPCFDTPAVKSTVIATIKSKLPVVFSGLPLEFSEKDVFKFEQKIPIPSYLFAIASGNIAHVQAGPRSTIYAEPDRLEDSKNEFEEDLEKFIQTAENIVTPYIWSTYDILINPSSFPYGGMENPNITFVTPTLISYDKSQVDVIAHELAHSWSGNNVTNANWQHFWLNEGWTVYLERRIVGALHGEKMRQFHFIMGWNDLIESVEVLPKFEYSKLVQDLQKGAIDPDDVFSSVPYEKGANFIYHLETKLGGVDEFDPFVKFYFTKFSKQSIDTYQFVDSLYEFYGKDGEKVGILDSIDWELWLYTAGLPPKAEFDTTLVDQVESLVSAWVLKATEFTQLSQFMEYFNTNFKRVYEELSSPQKIFFIDELLEKRPSPSFWNDNSIASDALLEIYPDLNESRNTEIIFRWFKFKLLSGKIQYHQKLADWLGTVGRMKYVRPSYKLLNKVDHELAIATFEKYKDRYHPIAANMVQKDLGL